MGPQCVFFENRTHVITDTEIPMRQQGHYYKTGRIVIGDDVWIGRSVMVMPCKKIGSHSVIAAGSVVSKDIPEYVVAGGNPVRIINERT